MQGRFVALQLHRIVCQAACYCMQLYDQSLELPAAIDEMSSTRRLDHREQIEIPFGDHAQEALAYGREHDLLKHLNEDPLSRVVRPSDQLQSTIPITNADGLTGDDHLERLEIPGVRLSNDKWPESNTVTAMIQSICHMPSAMEAKSLADLTYQLAFAKAIKLELPALRSHHGYDYREMCAGIETRRKVSINSHRLPLEPTDTEKDEGMEFPSAARRCSDILMQEIEKETIDVPKDAFRYLANQLRVTWTEKDQLEFLCSELTCKRHVDPCRLTPPIILDVRIPKYFIPSHERSHVPIPSGTTGFSPSAELRDVEAALFEEAKADWTLNLSSSPAALPAISSSPTTEFLLSQSALRMRPGDLKIEPPLLRDEDGNASIKMQYDRGQIFESLPHPEADQPFKDEDFLEASMMVELVKAEARVMRSIEQEHFEALDAQARVPVPIMDFRIPDPEWKRLGSNANAIFKFIEEGAGGDFNLTKWPRKRRAEEKMWWQPLVSGDYRMPMNERFDLNDHLLEQYLSMPSSDDVLSTSDLVYKRPGLAALGETAYGDEEQIEPAFAGAETTSPNDLMTMVKEKRKLLINNSTDKHLIPSKVSVLGRFDKTSNKRSLGNVGDEVPLLGGDEGMTASSLLDRFMSLHAPKRPKTTQSPYFSKSFQRPAIVTDCPGEHMQTDNVYVPLSFALPSAPCPAIKALPGPVKVIASAKLSPEVWRELQQANPGLSILKRNYAAHNPSVWHPGSVCRSQVMPALAEDVDIAISPGTGLMLTTMIRVRQKPIPGSEGRSVLRVLIEKASLRYERLIILISEGSRDDTMAAMSSSDTIAFTDLQGFTDSLNCSISVFYIAGGDKSLSIWITSFICRYSEEARQIQRFLLDEETYWELFLRQAGMNTYAAQSILGILKAPDDSIKSARSGMYGLSRFINMSPADRVTRFAHVLGGRRVLDRISRIVDASWNEQKA